MDPTQSVRWDETISFNRLRSVASQLRGLHLYRLLRFLVNLGGLLLQALLEFWPRTRINPMDEEENEVNHGKRGAPETTRSGSSGGPAR